MRYEKPTGLHADLGPRDAYPAVLRAMGSTVLYDYDPAFQVFYEGVAQKAQKAMRTAEPPLILHGEPVLGLEAAAASLIAKDDVVLNLASGVYGKGFGYWAARYAAKVLEIEVPYNDAIDPEAVRALLTAHPEVRVVSVCHHDTPSGTINPTSTTSAQSCAEAGALTDRRCRLVVRRDAHDARRLQGGHLRHGSEQVPGVPAGADPRRRVARRVEEDRRQPGCALCLDAQHHGLAQCLEAHASPFRSRRRWPRSTGWMPRSTCILRKGPRPCGRATR